jgi:hypothetical protein
MNSQVTIRIPVPRPFTREEMERATKAVAKIAGEVRKVAYPVDGPRVEK